MEELLEEDKTLLEEVEELLRNFRWMRKEVEHLQKILYGSTVSMKSWGVAQYGIEATLPKGSSGKSQAELEAMSLREERLYFRLKRYENQVYAMEAGADYLKNDKDVVLYDCLLEGMSYRAIGAHLGMNKNQVKETKRSILAQLCQNDQFIILLNLHPRN